MRNSLIWGLIAVSFWGGVAAAAPPDPDVDMSGSVGTVEVYTVDDNEQDHWVENGTVFPVDMDGDLLTARHVVAPTKLDYELDHKPLPADLDPKRKYLVWFGSPSIKAEAAPGDCGGSNVDVCVLTIQPVDLQRGNVKSAFRLLCKAPSNGDKIVSYGQVPTLDVNRTEGRISSPYNRLGKFQSDVQITAGMSGGPVTHDGYAYGLHMGAWAGNVTLIQPIYRFGTFLSDNKIPCPKEEAVAEDLATPPALIASPAPQDTQRSGPPPNSEAITTGHVAEIGPQQDATTPHPADCSQLTRSFALKYGPDHVARKHGFHRFLKADPGCQFESDSFDYSMPDGLSFVSFSSSLTAPDHYSMNFELPTTAQAQNFDLEVSVDQEPIEQKVALADIDAKISTVAAELQQIRIAPLERQVTDGSLASARDGSGQTTVTQTSADGSAVDDADEGSSTAAMIDDFGAVDNIIDVGGLLRPGDEAPRGSGGGDSGDDAAPYRGSDPVTHPDGSGLSHGHGGGSLAWVGGGDTDLVPTVDMSSPGSFSPLIPPDDPGSAYSAPAPLKLNEAAAAVDQAVLADLMKQRGLLAQPCPDIPVEIDRLLITSDTVPRTFVDDYRAKEGCSITSVDKPDTGSTGLSDLTLTISADGAHAFLRYTITPVAQQKLRVLMAGALHQVPRLEAPPAPENDPAEEEAPTS